AAAAANTNIQSMGRLRNIYGQVEGAGRKLATTTQKVGIQQGVVRRGTREYEAAMRRLGTATAKATESTFLQNQMLFTARRYLFYTTLAVCALSAGLFKLGYNYINTTQQAEVGFTTLLHSAQKAHAFVQRLFDLAAQTPLSFEQVTDAARKFIVLGNLDTVGTTKAIHALSDNLAAMGKTAPGNITRATIALGHMLGQGRVTSRILTQLSQDNITMLSALEEAYHTSYAGIQALTRRGAISSIDALKIWEKYVSKHYPDAARKLLNSSIPLLMTSVRDYLGRFVALVERPLLVRTRDFLSKVNDALAVAGKKGNWIAALTTFDARLGLMGSLSGPVGMLTNLFAALGAVLG